MAAAFVSVCHDIPNARPTKLVVLPFYWPFALRAARPYVDAQLLFAVEASLRQQWLQGDLR